MSAILGQCHWDDRPLSPEGLNPALAAMAPYGGHTLGPWVSTGIALAGRWRGNFAISASHELLCDGALTLVADARLDGRATLCQSLGVAQAERTQISDAELILLAYRRWGHDCPRHLLGDYAFAVWDSGARSLYLARDPVGARPLYYHKSAAGLAFASDIQALLNLPDIPRRVDVDEVARYVGYAPPHPPFFHEIDRLQPAHWLLASPGGMRLQRYWHPMEQPAILHARDADYVDQLHELLTIAVADRCHVACPVATHFSGGLDSSLVTLYAARQLRATGRALRAAIPWAPARSEDYPAYPDDERDIIDRLAGEWEIALQYPSGEPNEFHEGILLNPFHDNGFSIFDERSAMRLARDSGAGLLLSGTGGDAVLSAHDHGYALAMLVRGEWSPLATYLKRLLRRRSMLGGARQLLQQLLLPWLPNRAYLQWLRWTSPRPLVSSLLKPCHHHLLDGRRHPSLHARTRPDPRAMALIQLDIDAWRLEGCARWAAEFGLEQTYPLLDRRLLDFVFGTPRRLLWWEQKSRYLPRALLRREGGPLFWERNKRDPANQAKRGAWIEGMLNRVEADFRAGRWATDPHDVVDMRRLRQVMTQASEPPHRDRSPFVAGEILLALRAMNAHAES